MQTHTSFDVAVVGRAAIGLAAGLSLSRCGLRVVLIGPDAIDPSRARSGPTLADADDWDARVFALSPSTRGLLEPLGAWEAMDQQRVAPVYDMRIWPAAAGERGAELHFSAWQSRVDALAWIVENRNLLAGLEDRCTGTGIGVRRSNLESMDVHADPAWAQLQLADGTALRARLVIGADGAGSQVRALAGIEGSLTAYPQRAIVANYETALPHRDCAYQWFGPHGILALLPLPAPDDTGGADGADSADDTEGASGKGPGARPAGRCSIVWSAPTALAAKLIELEPQALAERVEALSGGQLGRMRPLGRQAVFPLRLGRVDSMIAPRVALVGDAAHVLHPLAGQGMNLGFGDVSTLAAVLREREPGRDPGERLLLRRYERKRAEPVAAMRLVTDGLQRLFDEHSPLAGGALGRPVRALRDLGWRAVADSRLLRRVLVGHAVH